jgi:hypothetical protein
MSDGKCCNSAVSASKPPADAPTPTMGKGWTDSPWWDLLPEGPESLSASALNAFLCLCDFTMSQTGAGKRGWQRGAVQIPNLRDTTMRPSPANFQDILRMYFHRETFSSFFIELIPAFCHIAAR